MNKMMRLQQITHYNSLKRTEYRLGVFIVAVIAGE